MEKMYSMNKPLNMESNMSAPKKGNMFHSVFNVFNVFWERVSKVPATFMVGNNYPLSVTVVHNEGIMSHEFFENLTTKRDILSTGNVYIQNHQTKESLNIINSIPHDIFDEKKPYESRICDTNAEDKLKFANNYIDNGEKDMKSTNCNYTRQIEKLNKENEESFEYVCLDINTHEISMENIHDYESTCNRSNSNEDQSSNSIDNRISSETILSKEPPSPTPDSDTITVEPVQQTTVSNMLTNMWHKVYDSVTDRFCKTDAMESNLGMKRSSLSPKQRRKVNAIAKSRGRGRARSQLRRSGVSQTRHRKERTKHDLEADIENDLRSWEELELYHMIDSKELEDCFSLDNDNTDEVDAAETFSSVTYTFADVEPTVQKPKTRKIDHGIPKFSNFRTKDANLFRQFCIDSRYRLRRNSFRPRLMSESSIDSEDSYCIVFETGSEATYKSEFEDMDESEMDESSEDDDTCKDEESIAPVQKVKFNLDPVVHVMVQWDYAYRAARRGPWEEMARDRERFKGRINCIERVLNPILTSQHRTHVWHERFSPNE
ncbi:protein phosphatase 1 regulatory subunit 15 isoform X2 [Andrena cerasifolii]